jgi:cell division protein FtsB
MLEIAAVKVFSDALPFMLMAGVGPQTVNKTRVVEAVITAIIVGVCVAYTGMYVALPVLTKEIEYLHEGQKEMKQLIKDMRDEMEKRAMARSALQALTDAKITQLQIEMAKRK